MATLRFGEHPFCLVCSQSNPMGLAVQYKLEEDGTVSASFLSHSALEGFEGLLHGGIIAALLDGAMLQCVFAHGYVAVTAELRVRYRHPVIIGEEILVRAKLIRAVSRLFELQAELTQSGQVKASAKGKFMQRNQ
jgi:uncharacterized protein (TIGR00369 family)